MLRDPTFLDKVPDDYKKFFIDSDPIAPYKLQMLKKMVAERFSVSSVQHNCKANCWKTSSSFFPVLSYE